MLCLICGMRLGPYFIKDQVLVLQPDVVRLLSISQTQFSIVQSVGFVSSGLVSPIAGYLMD